MPALALLSRVELLSQPSEGRILSIELQKPREMLRRREDLNLCGPFGPLGFRDRPIKPLLHASVKNTFAFLGRVELPSQPSQGRILSIELQEHGLYYTPNWIETKIRQLVFREVLF